MVANVLNSDGVLDTTFSGDGRLLYGFSPDDVDEALAMVLQLDGRIVIAGCIHGGGLLNDYLIARIEQDGSLDQTFGQGGFTRIEFSPSPDIALGVAIQSDGKIIAAGRSIFIRTARYLYPLFQGRFSWLDRSRHRGEAASRIDDRMCLDQRLNFTVFLGVFICEIFAVGPGQISRDDAGHSFVRILDHHGVRYLDEFVERHRP